MTEPTQEMIEANPLKVIARNWYGHLTENRARKLDRLWRKFMKALEPPQGDLFK